MIRRIKDAKSFNEAQRVMKERFAEIREMHDSLPDWLKQLEAGSQGGNEVKFLVELAVMYRMGLHDPQSEVILTQLHSQGWGQVESLAAGKHFTLVLIANNAAHARKKAKELGVKMLSNPVIEDVVVVSASRSPKSIQSEV